MGRRIGLLIIGLAFGVATALVGVLSSTLEAQALPSFWAPNGIARENAPLPKYSSQLELWPEMQALQDKIPASTRRDLASLPDSVLIREMLAREEHLYQTTVVENFGKGEALDSSDEALDNVLGQELFVGMEVRFHFGGLEFYRLISFRRDPATGRALCYEMGDYNHRQTATSSWSPSNRCSVNVKQRTVEFTSWHDREPGLTHDRFELSLPLDPNATPLIRARNVNAGAWEELHEGLTITYHDESAQFLLWSEFDSRKRKETNTSPDWTGAETEEQRLARLADSLRDEADE